MASIKTIAKHFAAADTVIQTLFGAKDLPETAPTILARQLKDAHWQYGLDLLEQANTLKSQAISAGIAFPAAASAVLVYLHAPSSSNSQLKPLEPDVEAYMLAKDSAGTLWRIATLGASILYCLKHC